MTLRLTATETEELRSRAKSEGRSMQEVARQAISDYIERENRRGMLDDVLTDYRVLETSYAANGPLMAEATERTLTRRLGDLHPDCRQCRRAVAAGMRNAASA